MKRVVPFGKPILSNEEKQAVLAVLDGSVLVHGPRVKQFEADFSVWTKAPNSLAVSSCTAGLHLFWFDLGIGPGDEVIVPAQTHSATAHAVEYTGASCVFVDCDPRTGNIDVDAMAAAITPRTCGISLVHFLGLPADMDGICAVGKKHGIPVLEDCALSIGATYKGKHTGLLGDAGVFSFYPVKHMTTAEGGMFITRHEGLAARIGKKRAFGVDRVVGERSVPGVYDVTMLGYNYRMNEIEGSIGIEQLKRMDDFLAKRSANYLALEEGLKSLTELTVLASHGSDEIVGSHYCLSVVLQPRLRSRRFELVQALNARGVGTSVYYPRPVPHMTYYREKYGHNEASFPNAATISYGSIALPVGPHLNLDDMTYMVDMMKQALSEVNG